MITPPVGFYTVATTLADRIKAALANSPDGVPDRVGVVPGELLAWDECECGLLAVGINRWYLTDDFPDEYATAEVRSLTACMPPYVVAQYHITILRCAPQPQESSQQTIAPTVESLNVAAYSNFYDAALVLNTATDVLCEYQTDEQIIDYIIGEQEQLGPQGMCVGSRLELRVGLERE